MEVNEFIEKILIDEKIRSRFTKDSLLKLYEAKVIDLKSKKVKADKIKDKALILVAKDVKKTFSGGTAVEFEGVIIADPGTYDPLGFLKRQALQQFKENPQKAIAEGYVNENGEPLDTRETLFGDKQNFNHGKTFKGEGNDRRKLYAVCLKAGESIPKRTIFTLYGDKVNIDVPLRVPVRLFARERDTDDKEVYILSSDKSTVVLEDWETEIGKKIKNNEIKTETLVRDFFDVLNGSESLSDWHEKNSKSFNKIVGLEGTIFDIAPMPSGNHRISLETGIDTIESALENISNPVPIVTCWLNSNSDVLAEGIRVIALGRTVKKIVQSSGQEEISLNLIGMFPLEEFETDAKEMTDTEFDLHEVDEVDEA